MKKLLLASALAAIVAGNASANENTIYVRADVGASMVEKQTVKGNNVNFGVKKATNAIGALGVGAYLMDNVRSELVLSNHFNGKYKTKSSSNVKSSTLKADITSLTLKGLVDVVDTGMGQIYAGAGVGVTKLQTRVSVKKSDDTSISGKKTKNGFSYLGTVGTSFDASEGVKLDLAYSYNVYEKIKANGFSAKFTSHDLTAGVRVEL